MLRRRRLAWTVLLYTDLGIDSSSRFLFTAWTNSHRDKVADATESPIAIADVCNKKLCYRRRTARRATSFKILSTVVTSCTANPQQIAVMELEGYS